MYLVIRIEFYLVGAREELLNSSDAFCCSYNKLNGVRAYGYYQKKIQTPILFSPNYEP